MVTDKLTDRKALSYRHLKSLPTSSIRGITRLPGCERNSQACLSVSVVNTELQYASVYEYRTTRYNANWTIYKKRRKTESVNCRTRTPSCRATLLR